MVSLKVYWKHLDFDWARGLVEMMAWSTGPLTSLGFHLAVLMAR